MASTNLMAELQIREFVARQKHQDELNEQDSARHRTDYGKRDDRQPGERLAELRQASISSAGPLCLLDAVGQAEERWMELFEHALRCDLPCCDVQGASQGKPKQSRLRAMFGDRTRRQADLFPV